MTFIETGATSIALTNIYMATDCSVSIKSVMGIDNTEENNSQYIIDDYSLIDIQSNQCVISEY